MNVGQASASAQANALVGAVTNSSTIKVYTGTIPTTPETAIGAQTLLATLTLPASSAFTQSNGVMTAASITAVTIAATGTAAFFRWTESNGTSVLGDGYCAASSGYSAWAANTAYTAGTSYVTNGGFTWRCRTTGTSATTGTGPLIPGPNLGDGTAFWDVVDMLIATVSLVSAAQLSVSSFTYTIPSV
jgi:hypothetical protein